MKNNIIIHTGMKNFIEAQEKLFKLGFEWISGNKGFISPKVYVDCECIRVELISKKLSYSKLAYYKRFDYKIYEYDNCPLFKKALELE